MVVVDGNARRQRSHTWTTTTTSRTRHLLRYHELLTAYNSERIANTIWLNIYIVSAELAAFTSTIANAVIAGLTYTTGLATSCTRGRTFFATTVAYAMRGGADRWKEKGG